VKRLRASHVVAIWALIYFPWLPGFPLRSFVPSVPYSYVLDANLAGEYALIAFSLVLLTGWVGQISLGQGAFVGIGAFTTALLAREVGIPFPINLPLVVLITAATAAVLGVVALRVRGLYLAVATLIFAWMADAYLFRAKWLVGAGGSSSIKNTVIGNPGTVTVFDFTNKRVFYLVVAACVGAAWFLVTNLRDSKTGRAFFAIRGSETAAVSLGIDVTRYKLLAFALSGALAGLAGNLFMTNNRTATPSVFQFTVSLFYLSIAVVGGITSLGGAIAASVLFAGLTEVFYRFAFLNGWLDIVTVGLLLVVLLGYPGGLGALGPTLTKRARQVRRALARARGRDESARRGAARRQRRSGGFAEALAALPPPPSAPDDEVVAPQADEHRHRRLSRMLPRPAARRVTRRTIDLAGVPATSSTTVEELVVETAAASSSPDWRAFDVSGFVLPDERSARQPVLEADHVTVQFGGLTAVNDVSLAVRQGEIVGLIGPNGAGKTTTFNAIAGLNEPTSGRVRFFGEDATRYPVHVRAQMGVGRTFQLIQLFGQLTVFDNLLVGTHVQNTTGVFAHLTQTDKAILAERAARQRVRLVIEMLGLQEFADRPTGGLPFGVLRQVEIARALVTEAPVLMLDEPASGLDNAETDELAQLLRYLRAHLGVTILLIEHDVRMVTSVCDYIYVLNRGQLLAEGTAGEIQRNPEVVAAYLGQAADEPVEARP
jgi:ABC-type branched-subunit amino acid transport system ATPase component/ABC-type branched-subunit amino acid transport system permease subunit